MNLNKILKDPIKIKILTFFNENPHSIDTPRGVATWIGHPRGMAKRALEELAKSGILIPHKVPSTTGYAYTHNPTVIIKINKFLKSKSKKKTK